MAAKKIELKFQGRLDKTGGLWTGTIASKLSGKQLETYKKLVAESYKPVDQGAAVHCIDGRSAKILDKSSNLGPQVASGGPGFASAWHCATAKPGDNVQDDFLAFSSAHKNSGDQFKLGGHTDDHASPPFCGCGAIDKMPEILDRMTDEASRAALEKNVQAILGKLYSPTIFQECLAALTSIDSDNYFKSRGYRRGLLQIVRKISGQKAVETMIGAHREAAVVINTAKNSTLDKEVLVAGTKDQTFNYDVWYTLQLANKLFKNKNAQLRFITANVAYNVATAMVLTNGSLQVAVRT